MELLIRGRLLIEASTDSTAHTVPPVTFGAEISSAFILSNLEKIVTLIHDVLAFFLYFSHRILNSALCFLILLGINGDYFLCCFIEQI